MLIVCPSCATSYKIDPAAVGSAGRMVRCARCKATWFTAGPKPAPEVTNFVDSVIAEAEAQSAGSARAAAPAPSAEPAPPPQTAQANADDFGAQDSESRAEVDTKAPPVEPPPRQPESAPAEAQGPEPVTIADAPSLVPMIEQAPLPASNAEIDSNDTESFAARRQRLQVQRKQARRSSRWTAGILLLVAFNVALVGGRNEVVRYLPQTASLFAAIELPVNLRGLKFEDVKILKEAQDGISMLIVEGSIVSTAGKPVEVPRLRFAARSTSRQEVYTWTALPTRSILGPGERLEFRSQLASPPADANDVMVRFFTAQDAMAGVK
jgi:predicted Zn finger-like uncharacterized protein